MTDSDSLSGVTVGAGLMTPQSRPTAAISQPSPAQRSDTLSRRRIATLSEPVADPGIEFWTGTWRAPEREPITGVWGRSPQRGPGAEPLVEGQGSFPLKPKVFQLSDVQWKWQNCLILPVLQSQ